MKRPQAFVTMACFLLSLLLLAGCTESDDDPPAPPDPILREQSELEPNNNFNSAQSVILPVILRGTVFHDGTTFGGTDDDRFDIFRINISRSGRFRFTLSELLIFNLDLNVLSQEAVTSISARIPGVNFFTSPVNAPSGGPVESFVAELSAGVQYFIRVQAHDTRLSRFSYTVTVEQE